MKTYQINLKKTNLYKILIYLFFQFSGFKRTSSNRPVFMKVVNQ